MEIIGLGMRCRLSLASAITGTTFLYFGYKIENEYKNRQMVFNVGVLKNGKLGVGVDF